MVESSLYVHCNGCKKWGCHTDHENGIECGNCGSKETTAYYPITKAEVSELEHPITKAEVSDLDHPINRCSFCDKSVKEVGHIVRGPIPKGATYQVTICSECVSGCVHLILGPKKKKEDANGLAKSEDRLTRESK